MRVPLVTLTALLALPGGTSLVAQEDRPGLPVELWQVPAGWSVRLDRPDAKIEDVKVVTMGNGLHVTLGPAILLYREGDRASGSYRVAATFTLTKPAAHPEAYGLFVGGSELQGDGQRYLYFLIRQDGKFLVKRRSGAETQTIIEWTGHESVRAPEGEASGTNELAIDVGAEQVRFLVNGAQVASLPRADVDAQGVYGYRVNHRLDLHLSPIAKSGGGATR